MSIISKKATWGRPIYTYGSDYPGNRRARLISNGADVFAVDSDNKTPMHLALEDGNFHEHKIKNLVDANADYEGIFCDRFEESVTKVGFRYLLTLVNVTDETWKKCFFQYPTGQKRQLAEFYLENTSSNFTLLEAFEKSHTIYVMAKILMDGNTDQIEKLAVEKNDLHIIEFLKGCTSQSFAEFYDGSSLLHIAAVKQVPVTMLDYLISYGAPLDAVDNNGQTALIISASTRNTESMEFLLSQNANVSVADTSGYTFLHYLILNYDVEQVDSFLNSNSFEISYLIEVLSIFTFPSPNAVALAEHIISLAENGTSVPQENLLVAQLYTGTYENKLDEF